MCDRCKTMVVPAHLVGKTVQVAEDPTRTKTLRTKYASAWSARVAKAGRRISDSFVTAGYENNTISYNALVHNNREIFSEEVDSTWVSPWVSAAYVAGRIQATVRLPGAAIATSEQLIADPTTAPAIRRASVAHRESTTKAARRDADLVTAAMRDAKAQGLPVGAAAIRETLHGRSRSEGRSAAEGLTVFTHTNALLDGFARAGITQVTPVLEMEIEGIAPVPLVIGVTAGDDRVCIICLVEVEGRVYTVVDAYGQLPKHGFCRCSFYPLGVLTSEPVGRAA